MVDLLEERLVNEFEGSGRRGSAFFFGFEVVIYLIYSLIFGNIFIFDFYFGEV